MTLERGKIVWCFDNAVKNLWHTPSKAYAEQLKRMTDEERDRFLNGTFELEDPGAQSNGRP